jgi:hypothetical protein
MMHALSIEKNLSHYRVPTDPSASSVLPTNAVGERPKYVCVSSDNNFYFDMGDSTVAAVGNAAGTGKSMLISANHPVILRTDSNTHYAWLELTGVTSKFTITPLENEGGSAAAAGSP